ncbi:MAG: hypothetical protein ACP5UB_02725 [Candidatus Sumerlaeaceae bacterium]
MSETKHAVVTAPRSKRTRTERIEVEATPFEAPENKRSRTREMQTGLGIVGAAFLAGLSIVLAVTLMTGVALVVTAGRILRTPFRARRHNGVRTLLTFSRSLLRR